MILTESFRFRVCSDFSSPRPVVYVACTSAFSVFMQHAKYSLPLSRLSILTSVSNGTLFRDTASMGSPEQSYVLYNCTFIGFVESGLGSSPPVDVRVLDSVLGVDVIVSTSISLTIMSAPFVDDDLDLALNIINTQQTQHTKTVTPIIIAILFDFLGTLTTGF